jgi:hypothetical protein
MCGAREITATALKFSAVVSVQHNQPEHVITQILSTKLLGVFC